MQKLCDQHANHEGRMDRMEKDIGNQYHKMDEMATKLNLILGAVILSPFLVAVFTLFFHMSKVK